MPAYVDVKTANRCARCRQRVILHHVPVAQQHKERGKPVMLCDRCVALALCTMTVRLHGWEEHPESRRHAGHERRILLHAFQVGEHYRTTQATDEVSQRMKQKHLLLPEALDRAVTPVPE